jgi:hypothetical protein
VGELDFDLAPYAIGLIGWRQQNFLPSSFPVALFVPQTSPSVDKSEKSSRFVSPGAKKFSWR